MNYWTHVSVLYTMCIILVASIKIVYLGAIKLNKHKIARFTVVSKISYSASVKPGTERFEVEFVERNL